MRVAVSLDSEFEFWRFTERHHGMLASRFPAVVVESTSDGAGGLVDAEVFFGWNIDPDWLTAAGLRWIASPAAGVDHLPVAEAHARGVMITRSFGFHGAPMAEHVMGLVLGFSRGLFLARSLQRDEQWCKPQVASTFFDVAGATMVIVGCGAVGVEVASAAAAFGMRVLGVRRSPGGQTGAVTGWYGPERVDEVLAQARVVVNLLPRTAATEGFFGPERFAAMRPGTVFINVGRGSTVDESALLEALDSERVSWCGLDVMRSKPPAMDDPLRLHPRVVMTPKTSVFSHRYMDQAVEFFADNLANYLAGEPLRGLVTSSLSDCGVSVG